MVVTDTQLFPPHDMKVRITSWDGRDFITDLQREWTVDKVKIVAMEHFSRSGDSVKTSLYHKLVNVRLAKTLSESMTISQEGVKENGNISLNLYILEITLFLSLLRHECNKNSYLFILF